MIVELSGSTAEDISVVGGKGAGLIRLMKHGFNVPEVWAIPANEKAFDNGTLSKNLDSNLSKFWDDFKNKFPDALLAVRSSATAEDMEGASFAGVYVTTLGVDSLDALKAAVKNCGDSLHSEAAVSYRAERGLSQDVTIGILLQRMVNSEVSGVLLTANPRRAFAREAVVDCAYGLGEGVVSGRIQPDHIVVDRETLEVREQMTGSKEFKVQYVPGKGVVDIPVEPELREKLCLDENQVTQLAEFGRSVIQKIGPRQDCEWAFEDGLLYLLQQRPITGLPPENPENMFSRKFADEFLTEYVVPLAENFVEWINVSNFTEVAALIGRPDLAKVKPVRLHNGYAYMNGNWASDYLMAYPKSFRAPGRIMPDWFTPIWFQKTVKKPFKLGYLLKAIKGPNNDPERGPADKTLTALDLHTADLDKNLRPKLDADFGKLSMEEWWQWWDEMYEYGINHFRIIRWGMSTHMIVFHGVLEFMLTKWAKDETKDIYFQTMSGLPGIRTAQINRDMFNMALIARGETELRKRILAKESYSDLRKSAEYPKFWHAFDAFIATHGHRGPSRSIIDPRWREHPEFVLGLIRAHMHGEEAVKNPEVMEKESMARRLDAEKEGLEKAGKGLFGGIKKKLLKKIMTRAQEFTVLRENQRYHLDFIICQQRLLCEDMGKRLAKEGTITEANDVYFIFAEELGILRSGSMNAKEIQKKISERKEHYQKWGNRVPATYLFDDIETEGDAVEGDPTPEQLAGETGGYLGVSRGIYKGKARVVLTMDQLDDIEPGDVLVAENIDPAWTNVFPLLGGLVTETGGILAHGALLAREYGIPAIMNVKDATETYSNGQILQLDGTSGIIEVLEEE